MDVILRVAAVLLAIPAAYLLVVGSYAVWVAWGIRREERRKRRSINDADENFKFLERMWLQPQLKSKDRLRREQEQIWAELGITDKGDPEQQ